MIEIISNPESWIAFLTLTALELVLGIDNIIFIAILVDRLPRERRDFARRLGLFLAMFMRIGLLVTLSWIISARAPLFSFMSLDFSWRDLILISGGLFLLWKSTQEIYALSRDAAEGAKTSHKESFGGIIFQIILIDIVFSFDSIITAVGLVNEVSIMIAAVVVSVALMMFFSVRIGNFVSDNPTIKMLALAFLWVVSVVLIADGLDTHVPKGYIYFAMTFSLLVEMLNIRVRRRRL